MLSAWMLTYALYGCGSTPPPKAPNRTAVTQRPQPIVQRLEVVVFLDPTLGASGSLQTQVSALLAEAGDQLVSRFGLEFHVKRYLPWPTVPDSLDAGFDTLEQIREKQEADFLLGLVRNSTAHRAQLSERVMSRYLVPTVVMSPRSIGSMGSRRGTALSDLQTLLQGIGTVFGALPACSETIMGSDPLAHEASAVRWGPTNSKLVRLHSALDLERAATASLPPDLAQRVSRLLASPGHDLACDKNGHLSRRRRVLGELLAPRIQAAGRVKKPIADALAAGLAALKAGDYPTALTYCGALAEQEPKSRATLCAAQAAEKLGRNRDAIRFYRALLANGPQQVGSLLALARLVGRAGDDSAALALLERCVRTDPESARAWLNLGIARARLGNSPGARAAWLALLKLDPEHAEAKSLLRQLDAHR